MTPATGQREEAAWLLRVAEHHVSPIVPLSALLPGRGPADAYAVQQPNIARRLSDGATVIGHKLGLTSRPRCVSSSASTNRTTAICWTTWSMTTTPFVSAGQKVEAHFSGLGSVAVSFVRPVRGEAHASRPPILAGHRHRLRKHLTPT